MSCSFLPSAMMEKAFSAAYSVANCLACFGPFLKQSLNSDGTILWLARETNFMFNPSAVVLYRTTVLLALDLS